MYRGNDSVFRISLIGIVFILFSFLLIVFSRMYSDADVARTEALALLDRHQQEVPQEAFESARKEFESRLSEEGMNADEIVRALFDKAKAETELTTLKQRVRELGTQLTGFTEVKKVLTHAGRVPVLDGTSTEALVSVFELRSRLEQELLFAAPATPGQDAPTKLTDSEIASRALAAIHFRRNMETLVARELGIPLVSGQESAWEQWLVADSQSFKSILGSAMSGVASGGQDDPRAISNLRAQVAFLRSRLDTNVAPPCWFDETGGVQFLFAIDLHPRHITVKSAWPRARETSALTIPGVKQLLERNQIPHSAFTESARAIAQQSGKQWCRHSVQVTDNVRSGMRSERIHRELENFFYLISSPH
jgi:hypothetical protein